MEKEWKRIVEAVQSNVRTHGVLLTVLMYCVPLFCVLALLCFLYVLGYSVIFLITGIAIGTAAYLLFGVLTRAKE